MGGVEPWKSVKGRACDKRLMIRRCYGDSVDACMHASHM